MRPEPTEETLSQSNLDAQEESALRLLEKALVKGEFGRAALVSSFGADSAVLLHMISRVKRDAPVLFVDTRMLFQETLEYQLELTEKFGLTDVRRITPDAEQVRRNDVFGRLHIYDPDSCCALRKTAPLDAALEDFDAWITGRKRHQADTRADLKLIEQADGRIKLNPLVFWERPEIAGYFEKHDLPRHPLVHKGFRSIGCGPCTSPVADGEDERAGRWRGRDKTECGIHFENGKLVRTTVAA